MSGPRPGPGETRVDASAARSPIALGPGSRLGPFRIVAELGRGGMGIVYRAFDERLRRDIALKTLSGLADDEALERFQREARAAARLRHPGIVAVYGAERHAGVRVLVLELVEGTSLAQRIAKDGPLPPAHAAALVRDVALAVQAAHEAKIVHRDLKPANVLLDASGRPRLTDFGLARDAQSSHITQAGTTLGTPAYMAPEQARADDARVGPTTDVYGLGAVLYEALSGEPPFTGAAGLPLLRKVIEEDPLPPSRPRVARKLAPVPRDLETICLRALEKAPEKRYPSATALAEDLARFVRGEPVLARPIGRIERLARSLRRRQLVAALVVVSFIAVAAPVALGLRANRLEAERERVAAEDAARTLAARRAEAAEKARAARAALDAMTATVTTTSFDQLGADAALGAELLRTGSTAQALARSARLLVPDDADVRALLARIDEAVGALAFDQSDHGLAVSSLRERLDLGATPAERVRLERALSAATRLPESVEAVTQADGHFRRREYAAALRDLEHALEAVPDSPGTLARLAVTAHMARDEARALDYAGQALVLRPRFALPHTVRAMVFFRRQDFAATRAEADTAVEIDPKSTQAYYFRGLARCGLDDARGAKADFVAAATLDPLSNVRDEARRALEELEKKGY